MRDLKYIIIQLSNIQPIAILFNGLISHSQVAEPFKNKKGITIISAGFCSINKTFETIFGTLVSISVFGGASSLDNLSSREEDKQIIEETLNRTKIF
jgi:hypothetical protein